MKRNFIISTVSLAASMFLLGGCYSLDLAPDYQLSSGTFWQTEDHAKQGIVAVYQMFQNDNVTGLLFAEDIAGGICTGYDVDPRNLAVGTINSNSGYVSNKWAALYEGVARANSVIQNVSEMNIDEGKKSVIIGEAKFLRAFFYNMLLNYYGGVPYYDETCVVAAEFANMLKPRSTADEIRTHIIADLDAAINVLPDYKGANDWAASDYGRATKGAAQALKAKVLLYNKKYSEAAAIFKQIIDKGNYSLEPEYADLFLPGKGTGDEGPEMIFAVQNMGGVGSDFGMPFTFRMGTRSSFGSCWDNVTLATDFVDSYENLDGTPFNWDDWFPGFTTNDEVKKEVFLLQNGSGYLNPERPAQLDKLLLMYETRDPRMAATVILPYTHYLGWASNAEKDMEYLIPASGSGNETNGSIRVNNSWKIYLFRKFVATGNMGGLINNRADTPINFPLIRYADVLLMYAECLNETSGPDAAAPYVNMVRNRAGMPNLRNVAGKDGMFKAIQHERAVELVGEGHSYMDRRRWGTLEELDGKSAKDLIGGGLYTHKVLSRDYLLPIPNGEIEKNSSLTQNPGW